MMVVAPIIAVASCDRRASGELRLLDRLRSLYRVYGYVCIDQPGELALHG